MYLVHYDLNDDIGDIIYTTGIGADGPDYIRGQDRADLLARLRDAINAELGEPATAPGDDVIRALARHALRGGNVAHDDHQTLLRAAGQAS